MAVIKAFKGIRPKKEHAHLVASKPYDVLNSKEAKIEAGDNHYSFLHVIKSEIDLPEEVDVHDQKVYLKAKENFEKLVQDEILFQDKVDCLYIYQQIMNNKKQIGLVACSSIEDYFNDVIKKHEFTRPEKEQDRINHIKTTDIHSGPVFSTYPNVAEIDTVINEVSFSTPDYDFTADDGVQHTLWVLRNQEKVNTLIKLFLEKVPATYIADGHHRAASSALVGKEKKEANPNHNGTEEYNFFLTVLFPANQLNIIDYNRIVKDLNSLSEEDFLNKLSNKFNITEKGNNAYKPEKLHDFGMYINNQWYSLTAKEGTYDDNDPVGILDVSILQNNVLDELLGIKDPRTDNRIDFVGGIRGLEELEKRVNSGKMKAAFALYPVTIQQLIDIANSGNLMPPKSTWFEPKLRSGLVIHKLT